MAALSDTTQPIRTVVEVVPILLEAQEVTVVFVKGAVTTALTTLVIAMPVYSAATADDRDPGVIVMVVAPAIEFAE